MKKKVIIYSNCQGRCIRDILLKHTTFSEKYDINNCTLIQNYEVIFRNEVLPSDEVFKSADLFIYQPISNERGIYSTEHILKKLKDTCIKISFPYIYNYALWEILLIRDGEDKLGKRIQNDLIINHEPITKLKEEGISFEIIEKSIRDGTFDFKFKERYEKTMSILRLKEEDCTIKVGDFIDANVIKHKLFFTPSHPTVYLIRYVTEKLLEILNLDPTELPNTLDECFYHAFSEGPIGVYSWNYYQFSYMNKPDISSINFTIEQARKIYDGTWLH
jgi:hypothetical protein